MRTVFVSSTVWGLETIRQKVKRCIDGADANLICILSESPDFPVSPESDRDTYEACLANVRLADFVIQILHKRYGTPDLVDHGELISITHMEFREALRFRKPIITLANQRLWTAYLARDTNLAARSSIDPRLFDILDERTGADKDGIAKGTKRGWVKAWSVWNDIEKALRSDLLTLDDSHFERDVTVSDQSQVLVNTEFDKTWEIRNTGMVKWIGRRLVEITPGKSLSSLPPSVPIAETMPGETVQITVRMKTGPYPALAISKWKMVDAEGNVCFPSLYPVYVEVYVVEH